MAGTRNDALVQKVHQGDENALAELLERYREPIRRVASRLLGRLLRPHLDSVDLLQLVHKTLLLGLRRQKLDFSKPEKLVALATTLMRRKVALYWRKIKRQRLAAPTTLGQLENSCITRDSPTEAFALAEEFQGLVEGLDPIDRRTLELRLEGYTTADAARRLGVDPSLLRMRLMRLRKRLIDHGHGD